MKVLREDLGNYADLTELPLDADVAGELRELNVRRGAGTACLWWLPLEFEDDEVWGRGPKVWLDAGTAGPAGALRWVDGDGIFVPASGLAALSRPAEWLPYFDWSGTSTQVHVALQVPIEQVFEAVAELVATRRRPECVEWVKTDGDILRLVGPLS
jgi:hypothetical protein